MGAMSNPLLGASTLPYQLPDFANLGVDDYREAIHEGMRRNLVAVQAIVDDPAAPTFENTIAALEAADVDLSRALSAFYTVVPAHGTDEIRALATELAPELAAHSDAIWMNQELFARIAAVAAGDQSALRSDAAHLTQRYLTSARLAGAELDDERREELAQLNARLATLRTQFQERLLKDTNDLAVVFDDAAELDGLSSEQIDMCADAARDRGLTGYLVALVNTTVHPYLATLTNRGTRRRLYEATA